MSARRRRQCFVTDWPELLGSSLSASEKLVALYLSDVQGKNASAWPSHAKIATALGMSDRHVRRAIATLEQFGVLVITTRGGGQRRPNHYTVNPAPVSGFGPAKPGAGVRVSATETRTKVTPEPGQNRPTNPARASDDPSQGSFSGILLRGEGARARAATPPNGSRSSNGSGRKVAASRRRKRPREDAGVTAARDALRSAIASSGGTYVARKADTRHLRDVVVAVEGTRGELDLDAALETSARAHVERIAPRCAPSAKRWAEDLSEWAARGSFLPPRSSPVSSRRGGMVPPASADEFERDDGGTLDVLRYE